MTPKRLGSLTELFPGRRIGVIGDFFLDKYLEVDPALIGNLTASVTVQQLAECGVCSPEELLPRLKMWLEQG